MVGNLQIIMLYGLKIQGIIPPLVEGQGPRTIFDAKEKAEQFNEYFAYSHCIHN